jgi:DNA repair protein RecO (recombination protein O)
MSSQTRIKLEPGYILHHYPYRDTSLLLEVFTKDHGRLGMVARGARGPANRQRPSLQSFRPLLVSWSSRGELGTLTGCESNGPMIALEGTALFSGFYLNELLMRLLLRQDPHAGLFHCYEQTLKGLSVEGGQRSLRLFEKKLLEELGYGLQLERDVQEHQPLAADGAYEFRLEHGPVAVPRSHRGALCFRCREFAGREKANAGGTRSLFG